MVEVSVFDAKDQLAELVERAEADEEIVLTRQGEPAARLTPVKRLPTQAERRALPESIRDAAPQDYSGPSAARSQDFLYGDDGLPA